MGTVLVLGGTGSLGTHLARTLADAGEKVVVTYRRSYHVPQLLSDIMESKVKTVRCDVMALPDLSRAIRDHGVDSIIHAVNSMPHNDDGTEYTCLQTNIMGVINTMEAAAIGSVKRVTYMSGGDMTMSSGEGEMVPIFPGSAGKKCGEILSLYYGAMYGMSVVIVRGNGHFWGTYNYDKHRPQTILRHIVEGSVTGKPVDLPNVGREEKVGLLYLGDIAAGITLLHLAPKPQRRVYVVPGGKITSWGEIAGIVKEFVPGSTINFGRSDIPDREPDPLPEVLAITSEFGFKPKYGLKGGLREYIEWYKRGQP